MYTAGSIYFVYAGNSAFHVLPDCLGGGLVVNVGQNSTRIKIYEHRARQETEFNPRLVPWPPIRNGLEDNKLFFSHPAASDLRMSPPLFA